MRPLLTGQIQFRDAVMASSECPNTNQDYYNTIQDIKIMNTNNFLQRNRKLLQPFQIKSKLITFDLIYERAIQACRQLQIIALCMKLIRESFGQIRPLSPECAHYSSLLLSFCLGIMSKLSILYRTKCAL